MIIVPPRSLKTEIVSKAFPVWCLWKSPKKKFMEISYSADLAQKSSWGARDMYSSQTYSKIFPRKVALKEDINTKQHWENVEWWQVYATGSTGTVTWVGADIIIIDDPLKPDEANSDLVRGNVNNNYFDTIKSRLNDKTNGAIILIMQRLHDDDLVGHLLELQREWLWEKWDVVKIQAVAEEDEQYRKKGESFFEKRFPLAILEQIKKENPVVFSCQYQQDPISKESQEFHEEWFRYYTEMVAWGRVFTTCDPAFTKNSTSDYSCIMTGKFVDDKLYILEYTVGRYDPGELIDKLVYHIKKRSPEKVGIEAYQAQTIIWFNLKIELSKKWLFTNVEDLKQTGDKETKIRKLLPLYRNWLIFHKPWMEDLETELKKFPRGKHDDMIDALQMLYSLYEIQPNNKAFTPKINIKRDQRGRPTISGSTEKDRL